MATAGPRKIVLRFSSEGLVEIVSGVEEADKILGRKTGGRVGVCEALIMVMEGKAVIVDEKGSPLTIEEAVSKASQLNPTAWVKIEVYSDLRRRGRIVVPGPRPNTLLVKLRKKSPNYDYYVLVAEEHKPIKLSVIMSFIEEAIKNSWTPLIAVVDEYGDVTYYMPSRFTKKQRA